MKKKPSNPTGSPLTPEEVENIAYTTLRDAGKLFPQSAEDLEALESELDGADVPKVNAERLLKMLRAELPRPELNLPQHAPEAMLEVTESLALAARKGAPKITDEIRAKMESDRMAAEAIKRKK